MEQFGIHPLVPLNPGGLDLSFTNSAAWMLAIVVVGTLLMVYGMRRRAMVPGRLQGLVELTYEFVAGMLRETVGSEGARYFPLVFTLFIFIVLANLFGMLPGGFTVTSHIVITLALALLVFVTVTIVGLSRHGMHFLSFFVPKGVPFAMLLLVVPIEVLSYFMRPVSHSVRLFANMTAGHTMLKVFGGFVVMMGAFGVLPFVVIVALSGLELAIALLQAYVFTVLTCLYLNDAVNLEH